MDIKLVPFKYNKTVVQEDGVTHKVDTEHSYTAYQLSITETYFEENKQQVAKNVVRDLNKLRDEITEILEQDQKKDDFER